MSFQNSPNNPIIKEKQIYRQKKGARLFMANPQRYFIHIRKERTSTFASAGSITLEAALVVPMFFFAMLCLVYVLEMIAIQNEIHNALHSVGKEVMEQVYVSPFLSTENIESHMVQNIGPERLERSMVVGGAGGIDCSDSKMNWNTSVIELSARYRMEIPVFIFPIPIITKEENLRIKGWTGYGSGTEWNAGTEYVYVTDYGLVYHKDKNCTYLDVSVRAVDADKMEDTRNKSGGKYYACEYCKNKNPDTYFYFVTDYGDRYHSSLNCSRLKRNIYAVPLDEVYGKGGCSKCVQ